MVHALVVVDAGVWLKDEPVTRSRLLSAVLGLIGVVVLIGPSALGSCRVDGGFFRRHMRTSCTSGFWHPPARPMRFSLLY